MLNFALSSIVAIENNRLDIALIIPDRVYIDSFKIGSKRWRESVAWRAFLRTKLREWGFAEDAKRCIEYDAVGAPRLVGSPLHFSVSHSSTHIAVVVSDRPCAVDIEGLGRNFSAVKSRYVNAAEESLESADTPLLALLWSAKETLYKLSGSSGLDLLNDLRIERIEPYGTASGQLYGVIKNQSVSEQKSETIRAVEMSYLVEQDHIVVYGG